MQENRLKIRAVKRNEIKELYELARQSPELWASRDIKFIFKENEFRNLITKGSISLVALINNELAGFSVCTYHGNTAEVLFVVVKNRYRRKGIGKELFNTSLRALEKKGIKRFYAYARTNNKKSLKYFKNLGFKQGHALYFLYKGNWTEKMEELK